jgi:hypothetical protein
VKKAEAIAWLKLFDVKVPNSQARGGWVVSQCPLGPWKHDGGASHDEAFGVKLEVGDSFCNCFSCGWHGNQSDLVLEMQALNKTHFQKKYPLGQALQLISQAEESMEYAGIEAPGIEELMAQGREDFHEFPQWWLDSFPSWADVPFAVEYLAQRGVPESVSHALDLRADTKERRICFPVRDFGGVLRGLHGRAVDKETEPRYRMYLQAKRNNPLIWLGESWVDLNRPILVVEGPFDLASVVRVYRNAVTPLFASPSLQKLKRMSDALEWVTLFDSGMGGDAGRKKVAKVLTDHVVTNLTPPKGVKDPGDMTIEQLVQTLGPHLPLDEIVIA